MNRADLIKTAKKLKQVDEKYAAEYSTKMELLVGKMNAIMEARPDIVEMVGKNNINMMKDNHANHARFLESIFCQHSPETLVDTVLWVFRAYISRNFSSTYWAAQLNTWIEIYKKELTQECYDAIYPYYNWMQINIPHFTILAEKETDAPSPAH